MSGKAVAHTIMKYLLLLLVLSTAAAAKNVTSDCANAAYDQCGGNGWAGETCCPDDCSCDGDDWYQQCVPAVMLACESDADCDDGLICVILDDRSFAQCVSCDSFADTCGSFSAALLLATEAACGVDACSGRCPNHTDDECADSQRCAVSAEGTQDMCLDCDDDALFGKECWAMAPESYLLAGLTLCDRDACAGRCPNHTDDECEGDTVCVVQDDGGYWDQCVSCTPKQFQDDCAVWESQGMDALIAAAEEKCGLACE